MLEVHVLGTSSARPAHGRHVSGSVVDTPSGQVVVDCGEGFQERMAVHTSRLKECGMQQRLRHTRVRSILLTHGHLDHCWGMFPMLQTMSLDGRTRPLVIAGPISDISFDILAASGCHAELVDPGIVKVDLARQWQQWWGMGATSEDLGFEVSWFAVDFSCGERWLELRPSTGEAILLDSRPRLLDGCTVVPHETLHSVPSCAWSISLADRAGRFDREKAEGLNLASPVISRLAEGIDVDHGGSVLAAAEFRGPPRQGVSVMISGDTGADVPSFKESEVSPTLLIHEATYTDDREDRARQWLHSTASDAARAARDLEAENLLLTHYSSRLESTHRSVQEARLIHQATAAAMDGDIIIIDIEGDARLSRFDGRGWSQVEDAFK